MRTIHLAKTFSTNTDARDQAEAGERGPLWIRADQQVSGRGRLTRRWVSDPGNLYCSALLPKPDGPASLASFASAVAVHDALCQWLRGDQVRLKWPNDVLVEGRKIAGILCETVGDQVICGIGINIAHHPAETRWPATHLQAHTTATVDAVFSALQSAMTIVMACPPQDIFERWQSVAHGLGGQVAVEESGRRFVGRFSRLGPNGELMLATRSATMAVVAGDVTFL